MAQIRTRSGAGKSVRRVAARASVVRARRTGAKICLRRGASCEPKKGTVLVSTSSAVGRSALRHRWEEAACPHLIEAVIGKARNHRRPKVVVAARRGRKERRHDSRALFDKPVCHAPFRPGRMRYVRGKRSTRASQSVGRAHARGPIGRRASAWKLPLPYRGGCGNMSAICATRPA